MRTIKQASCSVERSKGPAMRQPQEKEQENHEWQMSFLLTCVSGTIAVDDKIVEQVGLLISEYAHPRTTIWAHG